MKILLLTPHLRPLVRGNAVTVSRIADGLRRHGCDVRALPCAEGLAATADPPAIVHAFHAHDAGRVGLAVARSCGAPLVTTITGSDLFEALRDERRQETVEVLRASAAVTVFNPEIRSELLSRVPGLDVPVVAIPQAVGLAEAAVTRSNEVPVLLLPAGLRPVKNVLGCIAALAPLYRQGERFRLVIVGPVLDADYGARVVAEVAQQPFADYLGEIPHDEMSRLYAGADIVLNSSVFEGGMANSILEGMAAGLPVVASDAPGNRTIVDHGLTGFLYRSDEDFRSATLRLLRDSGLRERLGEAGRRVVREEFSPDREAQRYLDMYCDLLKNR